MNAFSPSHTSSNQWNIYADHAKELFDSLCKQLVDTQAEPHGPTYKNVWLGDGLELMLNNKASQHAKVVEALRDGKFFRWGA